VRVVGVDRGEQRLARHQPLAGAQQLAEEAATAAAGAVAEDGVHADAGIHEEQAASLANGRFARVEFDLDELHLRALDVIVDHVHRHGCRSCGVGGALPPG
jgi:hypothetical protein